MINLEPNPIQQLKNELEKSRRLALVAEKAHNPIIMLSAQGKISWCNEAFSLQTGYTPNELLNKNAEDILIGSKTSPETADKLRQAIQNGRSFEGEVFNRAQNGQEFCMGLSVTPIFDTESRGLDGFILIQTDVGMVQKEAGSVTGGGQSSSGDTSMKAALESANEQLENANAQMEDALSQANMMASEAAVANQVKNEFIGSITHEIRTPLNAMIGMAELLREAKLEPKSREYAESIYASGKMLLTIVDDILDFSKLEAGGIEIESKPFQLVSCLENTLDWVSPQAAQKGIDLAYAMNAGVPSSLIGDERHLSQILCNLLSNAVKFTEKGEVFLSVSSQPAEGEYETMTFAVKDTGAGIEPEQQEQLFQPFCSQKKSGSGIGLGLAMNKKLIEAMGGKIWVESQLEKGSTFLFELTFKRSLEDVPMEHRRGVHPTIEGQRLLIVESAPATRRVLTRLAEAWGALPASAPSAEDALNWLQRGDPVFDGVILSDADDADAVGRIQKFCETSQLGWISLRNRVQASLDESGVLAKPVHHAEFFNSLLRLFQSPADQKPAHPVLAEEKPLRILLAEDNPVNQKVTQQILKKLGYELEIANDGAVAVKKQNASGFDVILMDVIMPEVDGMEATRQIRQSSSSQKPWIIALTADPDPQSHQKCLEVGMNDYIHKPIRIENLIAALERVKTGVGGKSTIEH